MKSLRSSPLASSLGKKDMKTHHIFKTPSTSSTKRPQQYVRGLVTITGSGFDTCEAGIIVHSLFKECNIHGWTPASRPCLFLALAFDCHFSCFCRERGMLQIGRASCRE